MVKLWPNWFFSCLCIKCKIKDAVEWEETYLRDKLYATGFDLTGDEKDYGTYGLINDDDSDSDSDVE